MNDAEKIELLSNALAGLLDAFRTGEHYQTTNPYRRPYVVEGLKALGECNDISTFGDDWMDVLDNYPKKD